MEHEELFDDYYLNRLSPADRRAFEERLITDIFFKEAYDEFLGLMKIIERANFKNKLKQMHSSLFK